jgi:predicted PurR-regulated permease PerM
MNQEKRLISVSTGTMVRAVLVVLGAWLVYLLRDLVGLFLVSLLLAALLDPVADFFQRRKVPRSITVLVVYLLIFAVGGVLVFAIIPPFLVDLRGIGDGLRSFWTHAVSSLNALHALSANYGLESSFQLSIEAFNDSLTGWFNGLFSTISGFLGGIASFFVALTISYFLVVEKNSLREVVSPLVPGRLHDYIGLILNKMQRKVGQWLLGQLILMVFIGALAYIGLLVFGVKYALLLAVLAGLLEIVPYVGPVVAAIPAVFFALVDSPTKAVLIVLYYLLIQRLEHMILVPKIMQKTTGLNPIFAVLALAAGFVLGGAAGVLLSIPVAAALNVVLTEYSERQNKNV